jgi:hypothetical protein
LSRTRILYLCLLLLIQLNLNEVRLLGKATPVEAAQVPLTADWRFGVIESYEDPAEASNLGVAWTRVVFHWAAVQPDGAGTWTSKVTDTQISQEINSGRLVVGLLIGIPGWAMDGNGLPRGLWLPHDDPGNAWANFVREVTARFLGRINHWIIWNEPDIGQGAIAHTWGGSVDDFFQLQRTAYLVAKERNPAAIIHLPAFTYWADANAGTPQYMARLLDRMAADPAAAEHNYYFDVATAHLYFQTTQVFDLTQFFLGLMRQRGMMQPIWLVETNVPPFDDPAWSVPAPLLAATLEEQAAFMPQVVATALASGAERIAIYKLKDREEDRVANPEPFGLIRMDGSRRPAFTTYRLAIRYLAGMTGVRRERWDAIGQIRVTQGNRSTTVLFSRLPAPQRAQVTATADAAVLIDMWGNQRSIVAADAVFTVDLPAASCTQAIADYCMVGGATYYLVQSNDGSALPGVATETPSATATLTATTIPTTTPTIFPSETPAATPSNTSTPTHTASPTKTPAPASSATARLKAGPFNDIAQQPTILSATATPTLQSESGQEASRDALSYWFIGAGLLLALALSVGRGSLRRRT